MKAKKSTLMGSFFVMFYTCIAPLCCLETLALNTHPQSFPSASTQVDSGTLVVTYHTGRKSERIDRIRFRITDENNLTQSIYPIKDQFWDDAATNIRHVIIDSLKPGKYTVEFIIPNADGLFAPVPKRTVEILPGEIMKVDQAIKPRYGKIKAKADLPSHASPALSPPLLTLHDAQGSVKARGQHEITTTNLLPGEYTVTFESKPGFETPEPIKVKITPGYVAGPFQSNYTPSN